MENVPGLAAAVLLTQLLTLGYVSALYIIPMEIKLLPRDDPRHVRNIFFRDSDTQKHAL